MCRLRMVTFFCERFFHFQQRQHRCGSKAKRSRVTFVYRQEAAQTVKIALFYNRRFRRPSRKLLAWEGRYTAAFDPDFSLAITVTAGAVVQKHWLHFDAKYRLEPAEVAVILHDSGDEVMADADDDEIGYEQEILRLHRREDLFKIAHLPRRHFEYARDLHPVPRRWGRDAPGRQDPEFLYPSSVRVWRAGRLYVSERGRVRSLSGTG